MKNPSVQLISGLAREKAVNHILNVLDYDNFLCQCVKSHIDFSFGSVFSAFPANIDINNIVDFSWGYGKGSDSFLATRIFETLKSNAGAIVVFDDVMGEPENRNVQSSCLVNDNDVYHWICEADATELNLSHLIMATGVSWHFLCVVFQPEENIDIKNCILESKYNAFKNVVEVVVGAFDGEGYIHWSPNYIAR
jgi:hypothetical protein